MCMEKSTRLKHVKNQPHFELIWYIQIKLFFTKTAFIGVFYMYKPVKHEQKSLVKTKFSLPPPK